MCQEYYNKNKFICKTTCRECNETSPSVFQKYDSKQTSISEESIYKIYIQGRASAALAVAVHLQIFDLLTEEPQTVPLLANKLSVHERGLRAILRSLSAVEILQFS